MTNTPNPLNSKNLSRAGIAGVVLAVVGIILFILLWVILGEMGFDAFGRLIAALCIPPALMAGLIGTYILFVRPAMDKRKNS